MRNLVETLKLPAYRWLWFNSVFGSARLISVFVARGWLVLTLTDSPFWVGAAPAVRGLTQIVLGAFAGVMLDRVDRKTALFWVEIGNSAVALALALLILTGQIALWHVFVAALFEGVLISVRWPAINTMIVSVVEKEQVLNASAAQMLGFNLGNVAASALAGVIIASFGVEYGYFFAVATGLISAGCVLFVSGNFRPIAQTIHVTKAISEGIGYIRESQILLWLITLGFLMSFLGWSNLTMLPVVARDVLSGDASAFGYLTGAGALGSLISTALIASLGNYKDKAFLVLTSGILTSVGILAFSFSTWFALSLVLAGLMQAALMAFEVTLTASVLLNTTDEMHGRVQGIYTQVFGFTWVGGVFLGAIAEYTGAPTAIAIGGIAIGTIVLFAWAPLRRLMRA